jgi:hypothetical protein
MTRYTGSAPSATWSGVIYWISADTVGNTVDYAVPAALVRSVREWLIVFATFDCLPLYFLGAVGFLSLYRG